MCTFINNRDIVLKSSEDDKVILEIVHDKPSMTQREYALELGWTVDRVKYYLRKMKTQQIIRRVGSNHNGHWEVLIEDNRDKSKPKADF